MTVARYGVAIVLSLLLTASAPVGAPADAPRDSIAAIVARAMPAVVRIVVVRPVKPEDNKVGNSVPTALQQISTAFGSGFIIDPSGFIATNRHVVEDATAVFAVTADGLRYRATIIGMPSRMVDMALLRIDAGHALPFIPFGDSDKMRVGDTVIAIGSPFGFDSSVTDGIVSAVNRDIRESPFDDYIQTDASTNHGNSGGPLLNLAGEAIGMNSIIFAPASGWVGLTFALPSNDLHFVFDRLIKTGAVRAGMLPITTQQVSWMLKRAFDIPDMQGALVSDIRDDAGSALAGNIEPGDVILSFDGQKVMDSRDLARKAVQAPIGSDVTLEIYRAGTTLTAHVTIQAWPEDKPDATGPGPTRPLGLQLSLGTRQSGPPAVTVAAIDPAGTAADSGIQKGDILVEIQQTKVTDPDQALRLFAAQSATKRSFAAVMVERDSKHTWIPVAVPE